MDEFRMEFREDYYIRCASWPRGMRSIPCFGREPTGEPTPAVHFRCWQRYWDEQWAAEELRRLMIE